MTYQAKVIAGGKIVIPVDIRRELGIKDGDSVIIEREGVGAFSIRTRTQVAQHGRRRMREIFGPDYTVEQFVAESRADWGER